MGLFHIFNKKKQEQDKNSGKKKRVLTAEEITEQILLQKANLQKNGFKRYTINSCKDACEVCKSFGGKNFLLSRMVVGKNAPPFHDGCKCSISAYEDRNAYEKWLASLK